MTDIELKFTDETTSVFLGNATSSTDGVITAYTPSSPPIGATSHIESAEVTFTDASVPAGTAISNLNKIASFARTWQQGHRGKVCYVYLTIGTAVYRSELIDLRFEPNDDALNFELADGVVSGTLIWERKPYMESEVTVITLLSPDAINESTDGGVIIHQFGDATTDTDIYTSYNYAAAKDILGDLPTPVHITLESTDVYAIGDLFMSTARLASTDTVFNASFLMEGELGTPSSDLTSSTDVVDAHMSGNKFMRMLSSPLGAWIGQIEWYFNQLSFLFYYGAIFKPIIHWKTAPAHDVTLKLRFKGYTGYVYAESPSVAIESTDGALVTLLPNIKMPPYETPPAGNSSSTDAGVLVELCAYDSSTDAITLDLDFIQLYPMDYGRIYEELFATPLYEKLVDPNEWQQTELYPYTAIAGGSQIYNTHIVTGKPLMLSPGYFTNHIFYASLNPGAAPDAIKVKMTAKYRPRWRM